jgi:serine phosphatase RsbU (regulator of sigma subunit)
MASGLLAQGLDRCRTHDHEHHLVSQMRHGPPAALPGLTLAYGYRPSTFGLGVGGDFYDALLQPGGTSALVIGDVQGHDSHAAAMADRLRTALRAYALDGHAPAEVMARANRFLTHLNRDRDGAQYATCCYLTFAPDSGQVQICCAGHPHPILLADGEPPGLLALDAGLPLGVDPDHIYSASTFTLSPGSTLLLYTDGLIERPGADITLTTKEILRELDEIRPAQPGTILAGLPPLNDPGARYDDIAVLVARHA